MVIHECPVNGAGDRRMRSMVQSLGATWGVREGVEKCDQSGDSLQSRYRPGMAQVRQDLGIQARVGLYRLGGRLWWQGELLQRALGGPVYGAVGPRGLPLLPLWWRMEDSASSL